MLRVSCFLYAKVLVDLPGRYEHLAKSAPTILDDSLSADSYLNVLHMPSTFPRSELSRLFSQSGNIGSVSSNSDFDDGPRSNLDNVRYSECIHYLQEVSLMTALTFYPAASIKKISLVPCICNVKDCIKYWSFLQIVQQGMYHYKKPNVQGPMNCRIWRGPDTCTLNPAFCRGSSFEPLNSRP